MRRFRWVPGVVVLGLAGALVGVVPAGVSAVTARPRCRATAFVANFTSGTVSTIDVKTRKKDPTDIAVGPAPAALAVTPDGNTAFVPDFGPVASLSEAVDLLRELPPGIVGTVSTIDVKTRTKDPTDIPVGALPIAVAVTPDGKTAFVTNTGSGTVSTIDVKTRTKNPTDIPVGPYPVAVKVTPDGNTAVVTNFGPFPSLSDPAAASPGTVATFDVKTRTKNPTDIPVGVGAVGLAITPDGKTAVVANRASGTVSTIDVKTKTKNPTDIPVGGNPNAVAITPDGKTAFVSNLGNGTVSTIDVKTRTKDSDDIPVGSQPLGVAITPCRR